MGVEIPSQEEFQGLRLTDLKIDQAYVNVVRSTESIANNEQLYLYTREENCYGCPTPKYHCERTVFDDVTHLDQFRWENVSKLDNIQINA